MPKELVIAATHGIVEDEPIEEKDYWQENSICKGMKEQYSSFRLFHKLLDHLAGTLGLLLGE